MMLDKVVPTVKIFTFITKNNNNIIKEAKKYEKENLCGIHGKIIQYQRDDGPVNRRDSSYITFATTIQIPIWKLIAMVTISYLEGYLAVIFTKLSEI